METSSIAKKFLFLSPLIQSRNPSWLFIDISRTSHLFSNESQLMNRALQLAREFHSEATASIANHPAFAQVFSVWYSPSVVVSPHQQQPFLFSLPLMALKQLEGLIPWPSSHEIELIIHFFVELGYKNILDLQDFPIESFRERWGSTGELLWRKIHEMEQQSISPLLTRDSLHEFVHLNWPISSLPDLLQQLRLRLQQMCQRLQERSEQIRMISIQLYCEYSEGHHQIKLRPVQPSRDLHLLLKLLENQLIDIDLENPISHFEISIIACAEKCLQLDFFSPQIHDQDKLDQLLSLLQQSSIHAGFFNLTPSLLPEQSWSISSDFSPFADFCDQIDHPPKLTSPSQATSPIRIRPAYGQHLSHTPRPNRLLKAPQKISPSLVRQFHFFSPLPLERLEDHWWNCAVKRDYYYALTPQKQWVWIFRDLLLNEYYVHGYFD